MKYCDKLECRNRATHRVKVTFDTSIRVRDLCPEHTERWMHDAACLPQTTTGVATPLKEMKR